MYDLQVEAFVFLTSWVTLVVQLEELRVANFATCWVGYQYQIPYDHSFEPVDSFVSICED